MSLELHYNLRLPEWFHRRYPVGQHLVAKLRDGHTISVLVSKLESTGAVLKVTSAKGSATEHDIIALHLESLTRDGYIHISPYDLMLALNVFKPVHPLILEERERFPHLSPATNRL
ncbi:hypothetical protein [Marinobacterium stanieri]|uniref:Uncharacterized protein n=1 Tax=Marinobacterium stanieri TaxID=49186 RepID=A0A1N6XKI1_9GAMM|nr:hypothetical protein [Marinobacterium stanieri]SIR02855.1 hypothetical protein SAMN05421647_11477 [Marinobacterium stanieri]